MKYQKNTFINFAAVFIFFGLIFLLIKYSPQININDIQYVKIAGQYITVELALTEAEQAQGLSGRESLSENEGMLFVFSQPAKYFFWMKDMKFPLDIIWLAPSEGGDREAKIVYIKKDARPASPKLQRGEPELYPESYGPDENAKYVLEVVSGFSEKNDLKIGDRIMLVP